MKTIKIIKQLTDFRNWDVYYLQGDEDSIRKYFELRFPDKGIAVLELLNLEDLFVVTILPQE